MLKLQKAGKFISKKAFIAFLKKEIKNKAKAYKCNKANCPLARATGFAISSYSYSLYHDLLDLSIDFDLGPGVVRDLPSWASEFVERFDITLQPKTAKTALDIMLKSGVFTEPEPYI